MKHINIILVAICLFSSWTFSQNEPPPAANVLLQSAMTKAAGQKAVFVIFHASWCKWCTRLDHVLDTMVVKDIVDKYFVTLHIDVLERGEKIQVFENPNGQKLLEQFGGKDAGLPFYAFLDAHKKLIGNSNVMSKNENIGYPGSTDEINAFMKLIKKAAPRMTRKEESIIVDCLQKNAPKQ